MKYLPLLLAGVFRRPVRAVLTFLSIAMAFLLFGMLQAFSAGLSGSMQDLSTSVLVTASRMGHFEPLPLAMVREIEGLPGVRAATPSVGLVAEYRSPRERVQAFGVDTAKIATIVPEMTVSRDTLDRLNKSRTAVIVPTEMARNYGWKAGDRIVLNSDGRRNVDGSPAWPMEVAGVFDAKHSLLLGNHVLMNFDYLDAARGARRGTTSFIVVRLEDPSQASAVAKAIDTRFANSANETKTSNEREMAQDRLRQLGDVTLMISSILSAVFLALLFSIGTTLARAIHERTAEIGVLRAVGFGANAVWLLLLGETVLLCVTAALVGLGIAQAVFPAAAQSVGFAQVEGGPVIAMGLAAALVLATLAMLGPAWRAIRTPLADTLTANP